jgi:signal transduction histidine kinase
MISQILGSLYGRLSLVLAAIFLSLGISYATFLVYSMRTYEKEVSQTMHADLAQHVVDHYLLYKDGEPDLKAAKETFHNLMILGPNFEFYVLDTEGKILAYSAKPYLIKREEVSTHNFEIWRDSMATDGYLLGEDPRNTQGHKIFSVAPIKDGDKLYGYLYVILGSQIQENIENQLWDSKILQWGTWVFVGGFIFTLLVLLILMAWIMRPLSRLTQQVRNVRDLGFEKETTAFKKQLSELKRWQSESNNDVHILGHTFAMALETLEQQYQNVVSIDDLRKELLSHVSHDLRTPLASLLGYLETWEMQKETLSPEQSGEYISIAKRNAQRISTLIEQLFELAHLDGDNVQVNIENITIAELVQDVLQKFSIKAKQNNIQLAVSPQNSNVVVRADIEKLERVLTNLIENALRHTPEGGSVEVKIEENSGFVSIHVSDNGIGIPEQDLPFIFDPHFKAGNSVRENTAHGGLGLAITKKLLALHESAINVQSEVNRGTTFSFALPCAQA